MGVGIAKFNQEAIYFGCLLFRASNCLERGFIIDFTGDCLLQKRTVESATMLRAQVVDLAAPVFQSDTWLVEARFPALAPDLKSAFLKNLFTLRSPQLDVSEDNTITAQAALQAELLCIGV